MKIIGLIGGMSWESTEVYYRQLNQAVRQQLGGLHSAEIILRSFDFERVVQLQKANQWAQAGALLGEAAAALQRAGANCILICTNTMHLVAKEVAAQCQIPLIDIIDETARALKRAGARRPLLLATLYTMEHGFYHDRMKAHDLDVIVPGQNDRARVHSIIYDELCCGIIRIDSHETLLNIIRTGMDQGADSVILGCTEICLSLDPAKLPCPGFDSTTIHAQAAVRFALTEILDAGQPSTFLESGSR